MSVMFIHSFCLGSRGVSSNNASFLFQWLPPFGVFVVMCFLAFAPQAVSSLVQHSEAGRQCALEFVVKFQRGLA